MNSLLLRHIQSLLKNYLAESGAQMINMVFSDRKIRGISTGEY